MKLFLIRHGQTDFNLEDIYSGQSDAKLTELGRRQAASLQPILAHIPFDRVYSSDLSRAVDTKEIAIPEVKGIRDPRLREYDLGSLTGVSYQKVWEKYGSLNSDYTPFGGEDPVMVCQRLQAFLQKLEADPCDYAAAFTHNGVMKCMLRLLLGADADTSSVSNGNCNIAVVNYDGQRWTLLCWNYAANL